MQLQASAFSFLKTLSRNNDRDWFNANKDKYLKELAQVEAFADVLLIEMQKHDRIETPSGKKSLHRIYRDTRFSKDKTPYKTNWSGSFSRATKYLRGGYYYHLEPGNSFAGCGFWGPNTDDLKRIRQDIDLNYEDWQKLLKTKSIVKTFGQMQGDKLATAPQGYAKNHPGIESLRYKQFLFMHPFTDKEVMDPKFHKELAKVFKDIRPFFDYMSEVLTTDLNGESLF